MAFVSIELIVWGFIQHFFRKMAGTTEVSKVLDIVVVSDEGGGKESVLSSSSFRYTRPFLQSTFQLMGCKARHAFKVQA
ncbi:hypothetical protein AgCh_000238 [Apium graveolens]